MEGLGINGTMLLAQLINFGVIFFLLVWLLKKPIERVLRERSERIEQSLKDATEIKERLAKVEEESATLLSQARAQADELIAKGQQIAAEVQQKAELVARREASLIVEQARASSQLEQSRIISDLSEKLKETVRSSLARSFTELSVDDQRRAADRAISELISKTR